MTFSQSCLVHERCFLQNAILFFSILAVSKGFLAAQRDGRPSFSLHTLWIILTDKLLQPWTSAFSSLPVLKGKRRTYQQSLSSCLPNQTACPLAWPKNEKKRRSNPSTLTLRSRLSFWWIQLISTAPYRGNNDEIKPLKQRICKSLFKQDIQIWKRWLFVKFFNLCNPSGQTLKQRRSAKCYHRPIFDLYTCQYGPQEDFLQFCFSKKKFLLKNDKFLLKKTYPFLGVFLNLHRGKTVKYFLFFPASPWN